jgi:phytoene dehydrogenase-like protein
MTERYDAVVVGSGPNGLAAAIELARHDKHVLVIEGRDEIGGGTRTAELTLPGFLHDVCSAAHPFGPASPFLARLPLEDHGLRWITPPASVAHPLDDQPAVLLEGTVSATAAALGPDEAVYRRLVGPLADGADAVVEGILGPLPRIPRHPVTMARFGLEAVMPATRFAARFSTQRARALVAGLGAHSVLPLDRPATNGVGLALAVAGHRNGWPVAAGGSRAISDAMTAYLRTLGGEVRTGSWVSSLEELPPRRCHVARHHARPTRRDCGRPARRPLRHADATLALRAGRLQGRLRRVRPHPLGRSRRRPGRNGSCGGNARRDRGQ